MAIISNFKECSNQELKEKICKANLEAYNKNNAKHFDSVRNIPFYNSILSDRFGKIMEYLKQDNLKIIEIGCGTGIMTQHLFEKTKNSKIFCQDLSQDALDILKNKLNSNDLKRAKFICGDATTYFKNSKEKFDIVAVHGVLHHIFDYLDLVDSVTKNLKEGGIFYIASEPLPKRYYNYYLKEVLRTAERAFYEKNKLIYILYAPFNFLEPIFNSRYIKPIKDKLLHGEVRPYKEDFAEYWGYKKGVDIDKIKDIFNNNNMKIINYFTNTGLQYKSTYKLAKFLGINSEFGLIAIKNKN